MGILFLTTLGNQYLAKDGRLQIVAGVDDAGKPIAVDGVKVVLDRGDETTLAIHEPRGNRL